jgi:hypothetical protein
MTDLPFCPECGRPGVGLTGMHPDDHGVVRWTLYRCGHLHTEIALEQIDQVEQVDQVERADA